MYIYLHAKDATFNNDHEYIFELPGGLFLQGEVGLTEIEYSVKRRGKDLKCFDVCCDICDVSLAGDTVLPILRRVHVDKPQNFQIFQPTYYLPLSKPWAASLKVYIRPVHAVKSSFVIETFNCTLHIK